ncbi:FHA domain-containing protein [Planosporangium flavigriseum]|uniref:FHA domain-containing protein n=1 Tax=Planosporangium flavigriseum TaxID=373681 RepID=A0A8J3LZS2_9ACTN|nr:FHA domain-containing protein [Planosporangium flavigriseum]NJC64704.1 FHA domain-containing protein [Planosporangium flavigriseum]GIG74070.1 hypothetical protein Pfl04_24740 [Planosporangium flavigriseum]
MRFEVSHAMDTIERRLTTDVVMAQAVVDIGEIVRCTDLDDGRSVNLIRVGMVVDAFGRYLRDGGAMIYPVASRQLLSEAALTAKERMVLGRWTDEGLIETVRDAAARVLEIAELTGLPVIGLRDHAEVAKECEWLRDAPLRVLAVSPRGGGALLTDGTGGTGGVVLSRRGGEAGDPVPKMTPVPKAEEVGEEDRRQVRIWPDPTEPVYEPLPEPPDYLPASSPTGTALIARAWRCDEFGCPSFGADRSLGQPVPRLRDGKPVCPRHDEPLRDIGTRRPAVPMTLIVDGLRRRHFVVMADRPVFVGRAPEEPDSVGVNEWLHEAASRWISRTHLKLEIRDDRLVATDVSTNGTLVWVRANPGDRPDTFRLTRGKSYPLGEWDSVEMYTGIELCRADRRPRGVDESRDEPPSVLTDAPTSVMRQLSSNG